MTTVKVLIDAVGEYNAGDIVKDAPVGLVHMAEVGTVNAATGERIAEIVESKGNPDVDEALLARAKELKVPKADKMDNNQLTAAIETAEVEAAQEQELKELKASAKDLKIDGYGKMSAEELKAAITNAGKEIAELEAAAKKKQIEAEEEELKQLQAKAEDLKIKDVEKLNRQELIVAIEAAGGGKGEQ
jgi:hypothetical protein